MKGAIAAVVLTAACTTGICYFAFSPARPRDATIDGATDAEQLGQPFGSPATRLNTNESVAIATLKNISSAQAQCQASSVIDVNNNGAGEYGFFGELSGAQSTRNATARISPPMLSNAFAAVEAGRVARSGYLFQMFLPDSKGAGVAEAPHGGSQGLSIDAAQAEVRWCCYAWPQDDGTTGKRAFFVNELGDVLACENATRHYSGAARVPAVTAAFAPGGRGTLADALAVNRNGADGERWEVVN